MSKFGFIKNIVLLGALVVVVYLVANYGELLKYQLFQMLHIQQKSVEGVSTQRAQEISDKFKSDVSGQFYLIENHVLNFTVGDAITEFSRLQKIPQDFHAIQKYTTNQIDNFTKKK